MDPSWRPRDQRGPDLSYFRLVAIALAAIIANVKLYPEPITYGPMAILRAIADAFRTTPRPTIFGGLATHAWYDAANDRLTLDVDPLTGFSPPPGPSPDLSLRIELSFRSVGLFSPIATRYELKFDTRPLGPPLPTAVLARAEAAHLNAITAAATAPNPSPQFGGRAPHYLRAQQGPFTTVHPLGILLNLVFIAVLIDAERISARRARWAAADRLHAARLCSGCGYDVLALPTCPECGHPNPTHRPA